MMRRWQSDRAASAFLRYRMNINAPEVTHAQPLISEGEWGRVVSRPVPPAEGKPVIGVDLGGSIGALGALRPAPLAEWQNFEVWAVAPGVPSLADQEREDQVPEGDVCGTGAKRRAGRR